MSTDPFFANVSLLVHFNEPDASTTFLDSSSVGNTLTPNHNAQINDTIVKWGMGAYYSGGGFSDYVSTPVTTSGPLDLSTGDFTVEGWFYQTSSNSFSCPFVGCVVNGVSGWYISFIPSAPNQVSAQLFIGGVNKSVSSNIGITRDTWHHFAFVRSGDVWNIYIDGVGSPLPLTQSGNLGAPGTVLAFGSHPAVGSVSIDYLDDIRITKGVARYTADFTPPTEEFPDSAPLPPPPVVPTIFGGFVDASVYPLVQIGDVGSIKPRIYPPRPNPIARSRS